jgi:hypothetical protein
MNLVQNGIPEAEPLPDDNKRIKLTLNQLY